MSLLRSLLAPLAPRLCIGCGGVAGAAEPLCPGCRAALRRLGPAVAPPAAAAGTPVWAAVAYEGPARALVQSLKYAGRPELAEVMAAQIAAAAPPWILDGALVPVPLHPARLRARGFNQAAAIAARLAARAGLDVADCLVRERADPPQVGLPRAGRLRSAGGIAVAAGAPAPARAVLVDDVVTTGATLARCAAALRAAGVRDVAAVAWARTPGR